MDRSAVITFVEKHSRLFILAGICLAAIAVYGSFIRDYFFVDDFVWIYFSLGRFGDFFKNLTISQHVRPLLYLYFKFSYPWFHTQPYGYNSVNLLLHLLNLILVYLLAEKLTQQRLTAALSAAFFAVYFYASEAVIWISAVSVLMVTSLFLGACLLAIQGRRPFGKLRPALICLLFVAALLTHEAAIIFPLVWIAYFILYPAPANGGKLAKIWPAWAALLVLSLAYAVFHLTLYPHLQQFNAGQFLTTAWKSCEVMFIPAPVLLHKGNLLLQSLHAPFEFNWFWISLGMVLLVGGGFLLLRAAGHARDPFLSFGCAWLLLTLVPFVFKSAHLPVHYIDHRYSYLPAVGLSFIFGGFFSALYGHYRRKIILVLAMAILAGNCLLLVTFKEQKAIGKTVKKTFVQSIQNVAAEKGRDDVIYIYAPAWRIQEIRAIVGLFTRLPEGGIRILPGEWQPGLAAPGRHEVIYQCSLDINTIRRIHPSQDQPSPP